MFPLKSFTANKRCMLLQTGWVYFLAGIQEAGREGNACWSSWFSNCTKCLFTPRRGEERRAALVTVQHCLLGRIKTCVPRTALRKVKGRNRPTFPISISRKHSMESPQVFALFRPFSAKKKTSVNIETDALCCDMQDEGSLCCRTPPQPQEKGGKFCKALGDWSVQSLYLYLEALLCWVLYPSAQHPPVRDVLSGALSICKGERLLWFYREDLTGRVCCFKGTAPSKRCSFPCYEGFC